MRPAPLWLIAVVLGVLYWVMDGFLQAVLDETVPVIDAIFRPDPASISRRLIVFCLLIVSAVYLRARSPKRQQDIHESTSSPHSPEKPKT